jgi:hypothetical protein
LYMEVAMLDAVSAVGRTGGLGENRRVDHVQNHRAAQEAAAVESREKVAAAAVAALTQPQPAQEAERPQVDARPTTAVYLSDTGGRSEEAAGRAKEAAGRAKEAAAERAFTQADANNEAEVIPPGKAYARIPTLMEAAESAAEKEGIALERADANAYGAKSAENEQDLIARMSQLVQRLYELPA